MKRLRGMFHFLTADKHMTSLLSYYRHSHKQAELMQHHRGSVIKQHEFLKNPPPYVIERYLPNNGKYNLDVLVIITNAQIPHVDTFKLMDKEYVIFSNETDYQTALTTIQIMKD